MRTRPQGRLESLPTDQGHLQELRCGCRPPPPNVVPPGRAHGVFFGLFVTHLGVSSF
jgi:hypothetical protein